MYYLVLEIIYNSKPSIDPMAKVKLERLAGLQEEEVEKVTKEKEPEQWDRERSVNWFLDSGKIRAEEMVCMCVYTHGTPVLDTKKETAW